jgi:A/G-specific adenine glycosylase
LPAACFAATASFFFALALLTFNCFCEDFFWLDFGDLSPITFYFILRVDSPAAWNFLRRHWHHAQNGEDCKWDDAFAVLTQRRRIAILRALENPKVKFLVPRLLEWFAANARDLPWRRTNDPYLVYVSEIMLQQTQVKTVIPFWERWRRELPTIEAAAQASSDKIHKLWEGLGYYTRVRNLQKAAQVIVEKHGGKFPRDFDSVLALPGIGRYTAGAICSIAFNQPTPILDGNVIRVLTRIFGIAENPKEKATNARLWMLAEELVCRAKNTKETKDKNTSPPSRFSRDTNSCSHLNQSLMELGALVCMPRNPQCLICPIKRHCVAFKENRMAELPNLGKRETVTARHFIAFVVRHNGKFLVRQRPAGVVNAHLWEFPNAECADTKPDARRIFKTLFGFSPPEILPLDTVKHSITRYRITLEAFYVRFGGTSPHSKTKSGTRSARPSDEFSAPGTWLAPQEFDSIAFTSAHKKLASLATNRILSCR